MHGHMCLSEQVMYSKILHVGHTVNTDKHQQLHAALDDAIPCTQVAQGFAFVAGSTCLP